MRARSAQEAGSPVAITARQLEALIRLTEAEAKMRLSSIATAEDAERAIRLFMKFLQSVGIDMETGNIDIDVIMTGKPRSQQEKIALLMSLIAKLEQINNNKPIKVEELYKEAENEGLDRATVDKILSILRSNGEIYMPKQGYIKRTTT
jgi:replicative DNA helicase Mcm